VLIPDHFFMFFAIAEYGIFGHLLAFLIQSTADLYHRPLVKMTDADKVMHSHHFGTDPTDIRINTAIPIGITDDFW